MTTLVVGASGATGRLLVDQLVARGERVKIVVRSTAELPESLASHENVTAIRASILDLSENELAQHVHGCRAMASCLGHTLTFKGLFGHPRRLVTDATRRLCNAVKTNNPPAQVKFVLMNTTGNRNRDLQEPVSFAQRCVIGALRLLLPLHADNEDAADYLRTAIGQNDGTIEWCVVRPDGLVDHRAVSTYSVHPSPTRSAIFDAGQTSRINVGAFMAELICDDVLWNTWKGQMPVIYNDEDTTDNR